MTQGRNPDTKSPMALGLSTALNRHITNQEEYSRLLARVHDLAETNIELEAHIRGLLGEKLAAVRDSDRFSFRHRAGHREFLVTVPLNAEEALRTEELLETYELVTMLPAAKEAEKAEAQASSAAVDAMLGKPKGFVDTDPDGDHATEEQRGNPRIIGYDITLEEEGGFTEHRTLELPNISADEAVAQARAAFPGYAKYRVAPIFEEAI